MFPFRDNIPSRTVPLVTQVLIWTNLLVFAWQASMGQQMVEFIRQFGLVPAVVTGQAPPGPLGIILPFFISMFLHGGWFHVLGNVWFLYLFGDNVEDRLGHGRFLWFYVVAGLVAGIVHVLLNPASTVPTVGASGAIAGVLGAYLVMYPRARVATLLWLGFFIDVVELPAVTFLGFWFIVQIIEGLIALPMMDMGGVAWWAHIGGFATGFVFARLLCRECMLERHPVDPRPYQR
ncbi:MAG: rhomboid family intramembrane serine protease [Armatimonadetes bacterium]|nr:rhomboid family intramembrane serine protease [Armatimonadota bacterium]